MREIQRLKTKATNFCRVRLSLVFREQDSERESDREWEAEETEIKCLYASKFICLACFNAFHASTGSVNYRFEGTEHDVKRQSNIYTYIKKKIKKEKTRLSLIKRQIIVVTP